MNVITKQWSGNRSSINHPCQSCPGRLWKINSRLQGKFIVQGYVCACQGCSFKTKFKCKGGCSTPVSIHSCVICHHISPAIIRHLWKPFFWKQLRHSIGIQKRQRSSLKRAHFKVIITPRSIIHHTSTCRYSRSCRRLLFHFILFYQCHIFHACLKLDLLPVHGAFIRSQSLFMTPHYFITP